MKIDYSFTTKFSLSLSLYIYIYQNLSHLIIILHSHIIHIQFNQNFTNNFYVINFKNCCNFSKYIIMANVIQLSNYNITLDIYYKSWIQNWSMHIIILNKIYNFIFYYKPIYAFSNFIFFSTKLLSLLFFFFVRFKKFYMYN